MTKSISRRSFNAAVAASAGALMVGSRPSLAAGPDAFDVRIADLPRDGVPVIKPWKSVVIDPPYVGPWIATGDLDGDGELEIVCARFNKSGNERYTSSAIAHKLDGSVLWRWGNPGEGQRQLSHDVACQMYDWDNQGRPDVIVAAENKLVHIDGASGKVKRELSIPKNSSDCVAFANLTGGEYARDVIVKSRYEEIWALDHEGKVLWHAKMPHGCKTAHQARPMDIDGDGRDEVAVGYAMFNADGTLRWALDKAKYNLAGRTNGHLDCARVLRHAESPEDVRIVLTCCGDNRIFLTDGHGKVVWTQEGVHFQSVDVGHFIPGVPGKQIIVDIQSEPRGTVRVYDEQGKWLGQFTMDRNRHHNLVDWFGREQESLLLNQEHVLMDGHGKLEAIFDNPSPHGTDIQPSAKAQSIAWMDDFAGNGSLDYAMAFNPSEYVHIFRNEQGKAASIDANHRWERNTTLY